MIPPIYIRIITDKASQWAFSLQQLIAIQNTEQREDKSIFLENPIFKVTIESTPTKGKTHIYIIDKKLTKKERRNIIPSLTNGILYTTEE